MTEFKLSPAPKIEKLHSSIITISSEACYLEVVGDFIRKNAVIAGFDDKDAKSLELAVDEMVSNAIIHGYQSSPSGKITIEAIKIPQGIIIILEESGRRFNPREAKEPDLDAPLDKRKIGGLGLFIVKKIADELYFEDFPDNLKRFTLIKKKRKK